jgi:hypothetical protein
VLGPRARCGGRGAGGSIVQDASASPARFPAVGYPPVAMTILVAVDTATPGAARFARCAALITTGTEIIVTKVPPALSQAFLSSVLFTTVLILTALASAPAVPVTSSTGCGRKHGEECPYGHCQLLSISPKRAVYVELKSWRLQRFSGAADGLFRPNRRDHRSAGASLDFGAGPGETSSL